MNRLALWGVIIIGLITLLVHLSILCSVIWVGSGEFYLEGSVRNNIDEKFEREVQNKSNTDTPLGPASSMEQRFSGGRFDKVELAHGITPHLTKAEVNKRFELKDEMLKICEKIKYWNENRPAG